MNTTSKIFNAEINPKINLSFNVIKYLAIVTMTYDHVLKYIVGMEIENIILFPGRFAFPLFVFMICYHLVQKQNFLRYIIRLAPFAVATLLLYEHYFNIIRLNIMFTFMFAICLLWIMEKVIAAGDKKFAIFTAIILIFCIFPFAIFFEYRYLGIILFISFYYFVKTKNLMIGIISIIAIASFMPSLMYGILIIPFAILMLFINPTPNKNYGKFYTTGWMFYAYYPFQYYIIGIIRGFVGS